MGVEDSEMTSEDDVILQFRIWEQGRVEMEDLMEKLELMVQHALWEVVTEHLMMPNDIMASLNLPGISEEPIETLNNDFKSFTKVPAMLVAKYRVFKVIMDKSKYSI